MAHFYFSVNDKMKLGERRRVEIDAKMCGLYHSSNTTYVAKAQNNQKGEKFGKLLHAECFSSAHFAACCNCRPRCNKELKRTMV